MTERVHEDRIDREIGRFLAWEADDVGAAPSATEMALRVGSRVGARKAELQVSPRLGLVVVVGLLLVALAGGLVAVGMLLRESDVLVPKGRAYEAAFLRPGAVVGGFTDVVAVGVNAAGQERRIATIGGTWVTLNGPWGAISPSGLLAMPSGRGETNDLMHWEIFDLARPQAEPLIIPGIKQWFDELRSTPYYWVNGRGGAFWGPGDRLALLWYHLPTGGTPDVQVAFVDGRSGTTSQVVIPDGLVALPFWASDGSGIFVSTSATSIDPPGIYPPQVLRPDGSVVAVAAPLAEASCRTPEGFVLACSAPNDSMVFDYRVAPGESPPPVLITTADAARFAMDGSFVGWLEVDP